VRHVNHKPPGQRVESVARRVHFVKTLRLVRSAPLELLTERRLPCMCDIVRLVLVLVLNAVWLGCADPLDVVCRIVRLQEVPDFRVQGFRVLGFRVLGF
jgi:hypothetical protein